MRRKRNPDLLRFHEAVTPVEELRALSGVSKKTAQKISAAFGGGRDLANASVRQLMELGATKRQAEKIVAAFRLVAVCDAACEARVGGMALRSPADVAYFVRAALGRKPQEMFVVLLLDARQRVIDSFGVAAGSLSAVDVHPRELFRPAVQAGAHSVIIVHNHPSGDVDPSQADLDLTKRVAEVGGMVGIPVLDHLIVTKNESFSVRSVFPEMFKNPAKRKKAPNGRPGRQSRSAVFRRLMRI
jgi:DNA repair protein RadC